MQLPLPLPPLLLVLLTQTIFLSHYLLAFAHWAEIYGWPQCWVALNEISHPEGMKVSVSVLIWLVTVGLQLIILVWPAQFGQKSFWAQEEMAETEMRANCEPAETNMRLRCW